jgi:transcriptional regulator with XRE-family HTH domain
VTLSRIETGQTNVTMATLVALASVYKVTLGDLFTR